MEVRKYVAGFLLNIIFVVFLMPSASLADKPLEVTPEQKAKVLLQIQDLLLQIKVLQDKLEVLKQHEEQEVIRVVQVVEEGKIDSVTEHDHIKGNPLAEIMVITYTDLECPFCSRFHDTMETIMQEYAIEGKVAWTVRHFPLEMLHADAMGAAVASECVAKHDSNGAFWSFLDRYFELNDQYNNQTELLDEVLEIIGVEQEPFKTCYDSKATMNKVEEDMADAKENDVSGTPWSIIVSDEGEVLGHINGAQSFEVIKETFDNLLK